LRQIFLGKPAGRKGKRKKRAVNHRKGTWGGVREERYRKREGSKILEVENLAKKV